jgi:hypothetical protein
MNMLPDERIQPDSGLLTTFNDEMSSKCNGEQAMTLWLHRYAATLTFLGLIVGGIVFRLVDEFLWHCSILHVLGDALIVAGILGATVDYFLKRALVRDVGSIFIGWALPNEIRQRIREISQTSIVLQDYSMHIRLTMSGDEVILDQTVSWSVYNFSTGKEKYQSMFAVDLFEKPDKEITRCELTRNGKTKSWGMNDFKKGKKLFVENAHTITWKIPPITLQPQEATKADLKPACIVQWTSRSRLPNDYMATMDFWAPTLRVSVSVVCPSELIFSCDHPDLQDTATVTKWFHDKLFMKGELHCAPGTGPVP